MDHLQIDPRLDHHPDILAAGFSGATVFQAVLRAVAEFDKYGRLPKKFGPAWLARRLNLDEADVHRDPKAWVAAALARCVEAGLLVDEGDAWAVPGWDRFYKAAVPGHLRTRTWRDRNRMSVTPVTPVTDGRHGDAGVTARDGLRHCDATEQNTTPQNTTPQNVERKDPPPAKGPQVPALVEAPAGESVGWLGEDFWRWAQAKRQEASLAPERPLRPEKLSAWWSAVRSVVRDVEALKEGFFRFGDDEHWQRAKPPLPFQAFMAQWEKYTPLGVGGARVGT